MTCLDQYIATVADGDHLTPVRLHPDRQQRGRLRARIRKGFGLRSRRAGNCTPRCTPNFEEDAKHG